MSKSLGNFTTLTDLLSRSDGREYRLLVLQSHYRSPIDVTPATIDRAESTLERLDQLARRFELAPGELGVAPGEVGVTAAAMLEQGADPRVVAVFGERMDDDLDTPGALAGVFELAMRANSLAERAGMRRVEAAAAAAALYEALGVVLGGATRSTTRPPWLVAARNDAPERRDFAAADAIRDELTARDGRRTGRRHGSGADPAGVARSGARGWRPSRSRGATRRHCYVIARSARRGAAEVHAVVGTCRRATGEGEAECRWERSVVQRRKGLRFHREPDGGDDVFVHHTAIQMNGYRTLEEGQSVEFEVKDGPKGLEAENVRAGNLDRSRRPCAVVTFGHADRGDLVFPHSPFGESLGARLLRGGFA